MSYCPKDYRPCPDDLCHGSGCIRMDGHAMIEHCQVCGAFYDPDLEGCRCDYDGDPDWDQAEDADDWAPDPWEGL